MRSDCMPTKESSGCCLDDQVTKTMTGDDEAASRHRLAASMFLCWPGNRLDLAKQDDTLPELVAELAKLLARWEAKGVESERSPDRLMSLFEDHYWGSFEPDKDMLMDHVRSVIGIARR